MIQIENLHKTFRSAAGEHPALRGIELSVAAGEMLAVKGKSGSGKSTLLHLIGGLDSATSGHIRVGGREVGALSEKELAAWRGGSIGFVFQFFQLLPTLTVLENVLLPMDFRRALPAAARRERGL